MILHTGMTQQIMENIDPHDTMTPIDIFRVTDFDRLIDSRDTNRETQADTD